MIWKDNESDLRAAAKEICAGNVVAMPTETVYGLAANALDPEAVAKIFRAKGRPADNPLIVHIADRRDLFLYAEPNRWADTLIEAFWPGPLTMILPKKNIIPDIVTAGLPSVAVRFPAHKTAQALIRYSGCPLAAPSANLSGKPSGTRAEHVLSDFGDRIAGVIDGGDCVCGLESTVVSLLGEHPVLLRPGFVTPQQLREFLPDLSVARAVEEELRKDEKILSPGLAHRHYAPKAEAIGLLGSAEAAAEYIRSHSPRHPCAVMCFTGEEDRFCADYVIPYGHRGDFAEQGENLFRALRTLDETDAETIYVNAERGDGIGLAVYNRLLRACSFQMIRL